MRDAPPMKAILFGASGMVGQGVLRELLLDPAVTEVLAIVRRPLEPVPWPEIDVHKLVELERKDMTDFTPLAERLTGYDACFFCLGTSSAGMKEAAYRRVTYDVTLAAATVLARQNPQMTFLYVSGTGTDSTERGRSMWARVKGETENALLRLPFKAAYMLRPGFIQPRHGIRSRTRWLRLTYAALTPIIPIARLFGAGKIITDTASLGRAMIHIARHGAAKRVLENADLVAIAKTLPAR